MPTLPNGFTPTVAAYSHGGPGGVLRTEVAGGAARYSLDWYRGVQQFNVTLILDAGQLSVWMMFFHFIIKKGALAFDMPLDSGLGTQPHACSIVPGSYSTSRTGGIATVVTFVVEAQSAVYALSDAAVTAYALSATAMPAGFVPTVAAYAIEGAGGVLRSDVAGGVPRYGLDWDRGLQKYTCMLVMTRARFAIWSVWFYRLIDKGAKTFDMPLDSGFGTHPHACNILPDSYMAARTGGAMSVSFVVEAESRAYDFTAAEAQAVIDIHNAAGADFNPLLARLAKFATVDSLVLNF